MYLATGPLPDVIFIDSWLAMQGGVGENRAERGVIPCE